jgi:hypothetical protein
MGVAPMEIAYVIVANDVLARGGELAPAYDDPAAAVAEQPNMLVADLNPVSVAEPQATASAAPSAASAPTPMIAGDEDRLINLWRRLHPQGRRATFHYMAELLAEG